MHHYFDPESSRHRPRRRSNKTIYRKCSCGETAHDLGARFIRDENGEHMRDEHGRVKMVTGYYCRNCRKERPVPVRRSP